jgi:hypothetical protein
VKTLIPILGLTLAVTNSFAAELPVASSSYPESLPGLFEKYVQPHGVRYAAWHKDKDAMATLKEVTNFYATTRPPEEKKAALAWHLNAYNAWVLHNVLERYPIKGPLEGGDGFFKDPKIIISGRRMSLNDLEQKQIRDAFQEPRIHFALNCASKSCPPLLVRPMNPATLEEDLEMLTRTFLNENPEGIRISDKGKVRISRVFDWYSKDFGGKDKLLTYINTYRTSPLPKATVLEFLDYDWNLNAVP